MKLKKENTRCVYNASLTDSSNTGTMAIPGPVGRLNLLLGVPRKRWDRVLVSYGRLIAKLDSAFTPGTEINRQTDRQKVRQTDR